jgi:all-trans-8'-apo-beta-carotenal 15,15'-oxygenase
MMRIYSVFLFPCSLALTTTHAFGVYSPRNGLHQLQATPATEAFSTSSSSTSTSTFTFSSPSSPFWDNEQRVYETITEDPPPRDILKEIQKQPWKGGLEPIQPITGSIPNHTARIVEGAIPVDLVGILCRNGAGRIRVGGRKYGHWFDGDGLVSKLSLDGTTQTATYSAKYVPTKKFVEQQKLQREQQQQQKASNNKNDNNELPHLPVAGAWTKRGTGKWWENLLQFPANSANTNVWFVPTTMKSSSKTNSHGGVKLFALAEGGTPMELDIDTLDSVDGGAGETSGVVVAKDVSRITTVANQQGKQETFQGFFSAHYVQDPITKAIYNHGLQLVGLKPAILFMKLDEFGTIQHQVATELPFSCMVHDLVQTENYLIVVLPPYLQPPGAMLDALKGVTPFGHTYQWNPDNAISETTALIVAKDTLTCVGRISLPLFSFYHLIDAYEGKTDSTTLITVRTMVHDGPVETVRSRVEDCFADMYAASDIPACRMMEFQMNLSTQQFVSSRPIAPNTAAPGEFPETNSAWPSFQKKKFVYLNTREEGADYINSVQKIGLVQEQDSSPVITFGKGVYAGAPIFVPRPQATSEDDGYVLTQLYNSNEHGTDICILDAKTMSSLTVLRLDYPIPYQFHGAWWPLSSSSSLSDVQ